jgi:hypothetical protein
MFVGFEMFFLFMVFWCRVVAGLCRGFEMRRQISRFRGVVSRFGRWKFPVRAVRGTSRKIAAGALFPAVSLQRALAGKKLSLPGDTGRPSEASLTHCLKTAYRQMCRAVSGPNSIFSLRFPVQQGKSGCGLTPKSTWPGGGGGRWPRSIAPGRAGPLRRG